MRFVIDAAWHRLAEDLSVTPTLTRFANRHIAIHPDHQVRPADWAAITEHASGVHAATIEHARQSRRGLELELGL
jgi:hypothetical protein